MDVSSLALALGSSLTAGLNLYLTVLALGVLQRFEFLALPEGLQVLSHPWVMVAAGVLFAVEFLADKIPYIDNTWDAIHSFIRVPAGAILAGSAVADMPTHLVWVAALAGGFVSFTAHGAKASTRLAVNSTPEPFSNWFLSLAEDGLTLGVLWLVSEHPLLALGASTVLVILFTAVIYMFFKFFRMLYRNLRHSDRRALTEKYGSAT